ncbi:MAG: hypothetical protein DME96_06320 [Verrucomicrobia bacterium]|nr:MAG: hypothetical protein DME96_06320 [Verrucomicrobiota bacterium]
MAMPEEIFYLFIGSCIVGGFWFVLVVMPRIGRHRNSRRIQRGIEEYLALKSSGERITKSRLVQTYNLRKIQ